MEDLILQCLEEAEKHARDIEELENRTALHIEYAQEKHHERIHDARVGVGWQSALHVISFYGPDGNVLNAEYWEVLMELVRHVRLLKEPFVVLGDWNGEEDVAGAVDAVTDAVTDMDFTVVMIKINATFIKIIS